MGIILKRTNTVASNSGIKCLVYGMSGAGKTTLASTLANPLVISAESGLLSLSGFDIPYIQIDSADALREAYGFCASSESDGFDIVLDSISEIAEIILAEEKKKTKDPRQAYGATQERISEIVRAFRELNRNVVFIAKCEKSTDEQGRVMYAPSMPGNKLGQQMPYFFDFVLPLRVDRNAEGQQFRVLQTDSDGLWSAKSRTSHTTRLEMFVEPHLGNLFSKIKVEQS